MKYYVYGPLGMCLGVSRSLEGACLKADAFAVRNRYVRYQVQDADGEVVYAVKAI